MRHARRAGGNANSPAPGPCRRLRLAAIAALLLTGAWPAPLRAQTATAGAILGRVVDADTGAPLPGVLVATSAPDARVTTDGDGRFTMAALPMGPRTLVVSLVGYTLARPDVIVPAGGTLDVTIPLTPGAGAYTEALTVRADDPASRASGTVEFRMGSADLQELRGVLAEDPFRAIQAMPGVATGDDFRAEFSVRGSDFRQMGFALDGVPAPWLVHGPRAVNDTGTVAMVNADVLAEIGLTSGAQPQRYGNRTGAWVQSTMREGSRDAVRLTGSLSGTGVSAVVEGPLGGARKGAWLLSARKSYINWLIDRLAIQDQSAFGFSDAQSTWVYDVTPRQQLRLSAVAGRSRYHETDATPGANGLAVADTTAGLVIGAWRSTFGPALVVTQLASAGTLRYQNRGDFDQELTRGAEWTAGYRAEATLVAPARVTFDLGAAADRDRAHLGSRTYATAVPAPTLRATTDWHAARWRLGSVVRARATVAPTLSLDGGTRLDRESLTGRGSASPWLLARWTAATRWTLVAGGSVAWQAAELGMLPSDAGRPAPGLERARQLDLSSDIAVTARVSLRASLYDRQESGTLRLDGALPRLVGTVVRTPPFTNTWQNAVDVTARGVELTVRRSAGSGLVGWVGYGYGRTRNTDRITGARYWGDFDQRHQVNVYGSYRLGAATNLGVKFRYGSNMPLPAYLTGAVDALRPSAVRNDARLPPYARLDVRAGRTFLWGSRRLTLFAEVLNALDRDNLGRTGGTIRAGGIVSGFTQTLFPRLPSAGLRVEF